ncbi:MAG: hypothetical protein KatS3mg077_0544 [Candidatus Binatia bacterium]|nr:MAG: hypothetical protein KatS3mg077_0544 [Candidatus Binatia bacterium]
MGRPVTNDEFLFGDDGRDIGAMVHGEALPDRPAYAVGLCNGSGPSTTKEDTGHVVVARILITPLGAFKDDYVEGDLVGKILPGSASGSARPTLLTKPRDALRSAWV